MLQSKPLFPEHLSKGSEGVAVTFLQVWLKGLLYHTKEIDRLVPDGVYGPTTAQAVMFLQKRLGIIQDGNFGLEIRARVSEVYKIDFNAIDDGSINRKHRYLGPDGEQK